MCVYISVQLASKLLSLTKSVEVAALVLSFSCAGWCTGCALFMVVALLDLVIMFSFFLSRLVSMMCIVGAVVGIGAESFLLSGNAANVSENFCQNFNFPLSQDQIKG